MIGPLFDMFTAAIFIFFSGKLLNVCKSRAILFILEQQDLSPLTGGPTWVGILWKWASILPKLAGDGVCRLALFHALKIFLANEIYHFSKLSHHTTYLFGQPASYNQLLIQPL